MRYIHIEHSHYEIFNTNKLNNNLNLHINTTSSYLNKILKLIPRCLCSLQLEHKSMNLPYPIDNR